MRSLALLAALMVGIAAAPAARAQGQMVMVTGPLGGVWYPLGTGMAEILQKVDLRFTQQPGGGVSNAFNVNAGKAHVGFSTANVAASAVKGTADFENRAQTDLRLLAVLLPQEFAIAVWAGSNIRSVSDLKSRSVNTSPRGASNELILRRVLGIHGMTFNDIKASHTSTTDGVDQMKSKQAEAIGLLLTNPASALLDMASSAPIRLLSIEAPLMDKLKADYPGYTTEVIKAGTYAGQTTDTVTVGDPVVLVTRAQIDDATVYKMVKALLENRDRLIAIQKTMQLFTAKAAAANIGVPFHPGALRYFREVGVAN